MESVKDWIFVLIFFALLKVAHPETYSIKVLQSPQGCFGGSPFQVQPVVGVVNSQGLIVPTFTGSAYVQVGSSPSGFENMYLGTCELSGSCGTTVRGTIATVSFINGAASFQVSITNHCLLLLGKFLLIIEIIFFARACTHTHKRWL